MFDAHILGRQTDNLCFPGSTHCLGGRPTCACYSLRSQQALGHVTHSFPLCPFHSHGIAQSVTTPCSGLTQCLQVSSRQPSPASHAAWDGLLLQIMDFNARQFSRPGLTLYLGCCYRDCINLEGSSEAELELRRCSGCQLARCALGLMGGDSELAPSAGRVD